MKLKELLKHHNIAWPTDATHAVQDKDGEVKFAPSSNIVLDEDIWFRGDSVIHVAEVFDLPLASDWDTAIVAKQNWIQITKEQIKSIPVGSPIRVGGVETVLTYHYRSPTDYGFDVVDELNLLNGYIFANLDWGEGIEVEVIMKESSHPHASLMLQYAQDAAKTTEPHLLWQVRSSSNGVWRDAETTLAWCPVHEYRRKPKTHTVNGVEIPDLRITPKTYEEYYFPSPSHPSLAFRTQANYAHFNAADEHRLKHNLCYPPTDEGREAAILHAKAMLGDQS